VISPNDTVEDLLERIDEYFRAGVRCVWVVFPRRRVIYVYESEKKMQALTRADELEGGSVLPGFRLPLTALFLEESPPAESH
jgi:Uma2 family endonuclease